MVVFNKIDLLDSQQLLDLKDRFKELNPVRISVKDHG